MLAVSADIAYERKNHHVMSGLELPVGRALDRCIQLTKGYFAFGELCPANRCQFIVGEATNPNLRPSPGLALESSPRSK
jgi:hypothetical protein